MGRMGLMEDSGLFGVVVYVEMFQIQATDDCEIVTRVVKMLHDFVPGLSENISAQRMVSGTIGEGRVLGGSTRPLWVKLV
jgi:hypothetical protein